ncbi:MAG: hypothetical protein JWM68_2644 [Verrucomicrobiales bacterium]|nr:hypothetical protein [Verrucomicrobiales bacterium]
MEQVMKYKYQKAVRQLHKFVSENADFSDAEAMESLKAEGVNVQEFLARLGKASGHAGKQQTTTEKLRAIANRAGSRVKKLFGEEGTVAQVPGASLAYGRTGKKGDQRKKNSSSDKRAK